MGTAWWEEKLQEIATSRVNAGIPELELLGRD